ncbi:DUF1877 family protein [Nocardia alba]|uniref:Uncharacterized protein DUF1877 n=1 Tax=Nocardia alba TaxID=225051 RepID=A0A4R1F3T2_9NOCA|nr:DUF1877 family protein [Nocardia alba]TCJ88040.1 uncharacterized protein DUF1877 [Nocardia alba]
MAPSTWMQAVSDEEIRALRRAPAGIHELDKPNFYLTHFGGALNYFLTGQTWPGPEHHELWPVIGGTDSTPCATLENGSFSVIWPPRVVELATLLGGLDVTAVGIAVGRADFADLVDEHELYELELITPEEGPETIRTELERLIDFYSAAVDSGLGIVMYDS